MSSLFLLGRRFAAAVAVDALGAGLLRPFLILYGITVLHLPVAVAGGALTVGLFLGLAATVPIGRWIDARGPRAPLTTMLLVRCAGAVVLVSVGERAGFLAAALLLAMGNAGFRTSYAAMVATLAARRGRSDRDVDLALGAGRALANGGMGAGALLATAALTGGVGALRLLAVCTAAGYLTAATLIAGLRFEPRSPRAGGAGLVLRLFRVGSRGWSSRAGGAGVVSRFVRGMSRVWSSRADDAGLVPRFLRVGPRVWSSRTDGAGLVSRFLRIGRWARSSRTDGAALVSRQLRIGPRPRPPRPADAGTRRSLLRLGLLNLPYALHFDVLEVALPAVLAGPVGAPPAWSGVIFAGNTIMVLGLQIPLIRRLSRWPRRTVLSASGVVLAGSYLGFLAAGRLTDQAGGAAIAVVAIVYTLGEIAYTGSGTALVLAVTPPHRHGRTLARWELSTGLGKATAPAALAGLLAVGDVALWAGLALLTAAAAAGVYRFAPDDARGVESRPDDARRTEPRPDGATPDPADTVAAAARGARAGG